MGPRIKFGRGGNLPCHTLLFAPVPRRSSRERGAVLLASLFVVGALGITLGSYLLLVRNNYVLTARSQSWNAAMVLAEAGAEEGLAQLNPGPFVAPSSADRCANQWE